MGLQVQHKKASDNSSYHLPTFSPNPVSSAVVFMSIEYFIKRMSGWRNIVGSCPVQMEEDTKGSLKQ